MVQNEGIVLSRDRLEEHLWNFDYAGGSNVIDVYIRYLRKKIDEGHDTKLIHTVRGAGYVLRDGLRLNMCCERTKYKRQKERKYMKRLSLKMKLTLMYTFFMILLTCAAIAVLFSLSSREVLSSVQNTLENRVQQSVDDLSLKRES